MPDHWRTNLCDILLPMEYVLSFAKLCVQVGIEVGKDL